jgi:hypothetical protein
MSNIDPDWRPDQHKIPVVPTGTTPLDHGSAHGAIVSIFEAFDDMRLTENHVRQLHQTLLRHSDKDERHRGFYKTLANHVVAIDADGREIGFSKRCGRKSA